MELTKDFQIIKMIKGVRDEYTTSDSAFSSTISYQFSS